MKHFRLFAAVVLFMSLTISFENAPAPARADDGCQTFQETGFKACGRFLQYWAANGGLTQQGFPISDVFMEQNAPPPAGDGKVHKVQYFQRARFEYHPENQPPYDVLLGLLGTEQFKAKYSQVPSPPIQPDPCQYFRETDLFVCGGFLDYWQNHGGLAQQGLPISGIFDEQNAPPPAGDGKVHKVQYFQRARFEGHPENQPPYNILLGLLGGEQFKAKYAGVSITPVEPPAGLGGTPNNPTIRFVSIRGAAPGNTAGVNIRSAPLVLCHISYVTPGGSQSKAAGLVDKTTDNQGYAGWTWIIDTNTRPGTGSVTISCDGQGSVTAAIVIG